MKSMFQSNPSNVDKTAPGPQATLPVILVSDVPTPTGHSVKIAGFDEGQHPDESLAAFPANVTVPKSASFYAQKVQVLVVPVPSETTRLLFVCGKT